MVEQTAMTEPGSPLWVILPIVAVVLVALLGVIWKLLNGKIDKQAEDMKGIWKDQEETRTDLHDHDVQLAEGGVKLDMLIDTTKEMHKDVKELMKNCPKCSG